MALIEGGFVYAVGNKPISAGYAKAGAYVYENRELDARFCASGFQEFAETNAPSPTVKLQRIREILAVIAYLKWNFRAAGAPLAFLRSGPLKRDAYAKLLRG